MPVYVSREAARFGLPVSCDIRPNQWRVIQRASDRPAKLVEHAPLDASKSKTRVMIGGCLMTDPARYIFTFHGPKQIPFVFAAMFAAMIMQCGFARGQPDPYGTIDGRVAPKSEAADWVSQTARYEIPADHSCSRLLAERAFLAGGLRLGDEAQL